MLILITVLTLLVLLAFIKTMAIDKKLNTLQSSLLQGRAKTLVALMDDLQTGLNKDEVRKRLGLPDQPLSLEWVYELETHAAYILHFNSNGTIEEINLRAW